MKPVRDFLFQTNLALTMIVYHAITILSMIFNLYIREKQFSPMYFSTKISPIINPIYLNMIKIGNFKFRDIHLIISKTLIKRVKLNPLVKVRAKGSNKDRMKFKMLSPYSKSI